MANDKDFIVKNGLRTGANSIIGGNLTVSGDLLVNGNTVTVNSQTLTIDDPILTLGGDTAPTADDNKDRGIEFRYHNGTSAKLGFFGFDDSTGKMTFIPDATNTAEVFSGTKGMIDATLEWTDVLNKPDPTITVTLTGDVSGSGNVTLTDLASGTISISTTIGADTVTLGQDTTGNYVASIANGAFLTGATTSEGANLTLGVDATSAATASKVVARDASGNFSANTITASLSGNATTATSVSQSITFNNSGTGAASGTTYNGGTARTISHNTIGAQPLDATLTSLSALGTAANRFAYTTGVDTWAESTITTFGRSLVDDADAVAGRATLGLGSIATQNDSNVSITGGSISGITDLAIADGGTGASDAATARTNLGLAIGTNVQAYDADLAAIAGLATTDGNFIVGNGTTWVAESGATARTSLGLGTIATQNANAVTITGGSINGTAIGDTTQSTGKFNQLTLNNNTSSSKTIFFENDNSRRWAFLVNAATESGGNTGSNLVINRYDDTGTLISGAAFSINRATGITTISQLTLTTPLAISELAASTISGISLGNNLNTLTRGTYLTGSNYNGSAATTWAVDATTTNTASKVVARDASGNFSANTITASLSGNATTATSVSQSITFNNSGTGDASGTTFNGSAARTISHNTIGASPLAGSASLTTVGTITSGTWNGSIISPTYGGTGVNNGTRTITVNTANVAFTAAAGGSSLTLPASGTVATLAGTETFTNKTLTSPTLTTPRFVNGGSIADSNGNELIGFNLVASAANFVNVTNSATGASPVIASDGSDTNVSLTFNTKGSGAIILDTGTGAGDVQVRPGTGVFAVFDDDSTHAVRFVTGNKTANTNLTIPVAGDVTLVAGTMVPTTGTGASGTWGISITGNSATANSVSNSITFNNSGTGASSGTTFDGSAARTISHNTIGASPLAGSASLTTVGTITSGTWNGSIISGTFGGTGVNNGARTITLGGNISTANSFTTSGNFALTLTQTGATNVTLPTTGTLATRDGSETLSNKILTAPRFANGGFIADANGNEMLSFTTTASAANFLTLSNSTSGLPVILSTGGSDTNVSLRITTKGATSTIGITDFSALSGIGISRDAVEINAGGSNTSVYIIGDIITTTGGKGTSTVSGTIIATQAEAEAGTVDNKIMTPLRTAQAIAKLGTTQWYTPIGTADAGTAYDFTGIPIEATEIIIVLNGISLSGTDDLLIQVGNTSGPISTGYTSTSADLRSTGQDVSTSTAGFIVRLADPADSCNAVVKLYRASFGVNAWVSSHAGTSSGNTTGALSGGGTITLGSGNVLDRIRLTRTGTNTFDSGRVRIGYTI